MIKKIHYSAQPSPWMGPLFIVLFMSFACLFFLGLDRFGLFDVDEAIFTQASVEMIEKGDYVAPTYNDEPRYHKPPLIYWLQSAVMSKGEISPFYARLPSAVFAFLTVFGFYLFLSGMTGNKRYALTATAILGLNLSYMIISHAATADMALNFFILMGTMTLLANMYASRMDKVAQVIAGIILGLGLLTKGPIALFVPGVAVLLVWLAGGNFWYHVRCVNPFYVGLSMLIVVVPWCYFIIDAKGMDFFKEFWLVHNLGRFVGGLGNTQSSSGFYYIIVLLVGFFPWVLLIPGAVVSLLRDYGVLSRIRSQDPIDALPIIGLVWGVAVVVLFSFSATKLPHYIIPALPGFAMLIAARLEKLHIEGVNPLTWVVFIPMVALLASLFIGIKVLPHLLMGEGSPFMLRQMKDLSLLFNFTWPVQDAGIVAILSQNVQVSIVPVMVGALLLVGGSLSWWLMSLAQRVGLVSMAATMWMSLMLIALGVVPVVYDFLQKPLASIGTEIKAGYNESSDRLYFLAIHQPSVRFVSGVPFVSAYLPEDLKGANTVKGKVWVVLKEDRLEPLKEFVATSDGFVSQCKGGYCLVKIQGQAKASLAE